MLCTMRCTIMGSTSPMFISACNSAYARAGLEASSCRVCSGLAIAIFLICESTSSIWALLMAESTAVIASVLGVAMEARGEAEGWDDWEGG